MPRIPSILRLLGALGDPGGSMREWEGTMSLSVQVSASLTRPSDTTTYAAGDAVTDSTSAPSVLTFTGCAAQDGGSGLLVQAVLVDSANQSTKGQFELWLFSSAPAPDNDNSAFTPTGAECRNLVGIIEFSGPFVGTASSGADGNCVYQASALNLPFRCAAGARALYGLLVVRNGYTPVAEERFDLILGLLFDQP